MESAEVSAARASGLLESRTFRLILLRRIRLRREGSLAAALTQSMALAVMGTAGAYPSWVLVKEPRGQFVLGAAWAVSRVDPAPGSPLLGSAGAPLMQAIAFCCLLSVLSGSLALTLDFLGRRRGRMMAPLLHGLTAVLIACAAALGSCLLALVRGRIHTEPELRRHRFSTSPGQSLFLAFLACALASTATGLSCTSPARVEPARSSWDFGVGGGGGGGGGRHHRFLFRYSVSDSAASASTQSSAATGSSLQGGSAESGRSGRVHWRDAGAQELAEAEQGEEEGEGGAGQAVRESPSDAGEKGWLQRYWEATGWLFGALAELARRQNGTEAASQPPGEDGGSAPGENGQEAGFSRRTDV